MKTELSDSKNSEEDFKEAQRALGITRELIKEGNRICLFLTKELQQLFII